MKISGKSCENFKNLGIKKKKEKLFAPQNILPKKDIMSFAICDRTLSF